MLGGDIKEYQVLLDPARMKHYNVTLAEVIAKSGLPCCLMHNRKEADYRDFMQDVAADLADTIHLAEAAGIADEKIILDPGVGFGKTYENNLEIINCLEELNMFGYPLLLGWGSNTSLTSEWLNS